jgi:hypothetical protein
MGASNRVGIGLSYRPARLNRPVELTLKSILGLLRSLKIRAQDSPSQQSQKIENEWRTSRLCVLPNEGMACFHVDSLVVFTAETSSTIAHYSVRRTPNPTSDTDTEPYKDILGLLSLVHR